MQNWRPISLLNVDYKLAAHTIAARLLKVIQLVVPKDQTCGVPGRYIGENVAFLRDIVSFAGTFDSPVVIYLRTRRRPLIGWIGVLCKPLSAKWGLAPLFSSGLIYLILMCRVLSM